MGTKYIGNGEKKPSTIRVMGIPSLTPDERAKAEAAKREADAARPPCIDEAEAKETGPRVLGIPERWFKPPGPLWRCQRGHVRASSVKSGLHGATLCVECASRVYITYPEDKDGPENTADVELRLTPAPSGPFPKDQLREAGGEPVPGVIGRVLTRDELQAVSDLAHAVRNSRQNVGQRLTDMADVVIRAVDPKLGRIKEFARTRQKLLFSTSNEAEKTDMPPA